MSARSRAVLVLAVAVPATVVAFAAPASDNSVESAAALSDRTGVLQLPGGYSYDGDWLDGRPTGVGKATFPDGTVYIGGFLDGAANGPGKNHVR